MNVLGHHRLLEIKNSVISYGTSVYDMFEMRQATNEVTLLKSVHLVFNAPSAELVDDFYKTAIKMEAKCNGKPDFRPEYEEGYYAAYVIDPDGHNVEAVYKE